MHDAWIQRGLDELIDDALRATPVQDPPGGFTRRVRIRVEIQAALDKQRRRLVTGVLAVAAGLAGAGLLSAFVAASPRELLATLSHHTPGLLGRLDSLMGATALPASALTASVTVLCVVPVLLAVLLWPAKAAYRPQTR